MNKDQYTLFRDIVEGYGGNPRDNYSGRGMYGKECLGADFDSMQEFLEAMFEINESLPDFEWGNVTTDSMGLGTVFYWRGIRVDE